MGELPIPYPFSYSLISHFNLETLKIILPYAIALAAVGLLESLLTAQIVDDLTDTPSDKTANVKVRVWRISLPALVVWRVVP